MISSAYRRKAKLRRHRQKAQSRSSSVLGLGAAAKGAGVPEFAPTPVRLSHGDVRRTQLVERIQDRAPDRTGDRPDAPQREVIVGVVRRDLNAFAADRLAR